MLKIDNFIEYISKVFNGNISKAAMAFEIPQTTMNSIVKSKRRAGLKSILKIKQYCKKNFIATELFFFE